MTMQHTHLPLGELMEFLSVSYWISQEDKIPYKGKEVLSIVRETSAMLSCCAGGYSPGFRSILIPGFIRKFKYTRGEDGLFISEVEPVEDENVKEEVRKIVLEKYPSSQIEFSCP
jgi:hypothetical protein